MKDIRILVFDDHELVRCGIRGMLEQEEDMEVVGDCSSAEEALLLTQIVSPNILLLEARVPGTDRFEITRRVHQKRMSCNVIALARHEDCLAEALEAGVAGYLLEDIKSQKLAEAIRRVYNGELVIDERLKSSSQPARGDSECLPPEDGSILIREVELTVPLPFSAPQLLRFMCRTEKVLEATVVQQIGSWNRGSVVSILLRKATSPLDILDRLEKMPDVDLVSEKPAVKSSPLTSSNGVVTRPGTYPRKQFLVTLKAG